MTKTAVVIIPAYNPSLAELMATVDSLISQTCPIDVCIIDDGSVVPITVQSHPDVIVLRQNRNQGITAALRRGVDYALANNYRYVARLDIGDIPYSERIERQINWMESHPDTDLLGTRSRIVDPKGRHLYDFGVCGSDAIRRYLWKNSAFRHSTFMIRADSLRRLGNYNDEFVLAQDYEMLLRYARFGRVDCLDEILLDYVDDPKGLTVKRRKRQLQMRLKAQLLHRSPRALGWYVGILRTVVTMVVPVAVIARARRAMQ